MTKLNPESIEKFQETLRRDPNSLAFAALSEAYRERGLLQQGLKLAQDGVQRHPNYASGWLCLGRIHLDMKSIKLAETALKKATELDPQNLLAHLILGECFILEQNPKEALRHFKRVLFLSPQNEKALLSISRLESLTADEYEDDTFMMASPSATNQETITSLERSLSLLDALIVRGDLDKAEDMVSKLELFYPGHIEVRKRRGILTESSQSEEELTEEITPLQSRENEVLLRKKAALENLLQRVTSLNFGPRNTP